MTDALTTWQSAFFHEAPVRLATRQPPAFRDERTGIVNEDEGASLGMNLSGALVKLLDNPSGVRGLLSRWDRFCRSRHQRWPDHAERPACAELAWLVIRDRVGLPQSAERTGLSVERAAHLIEGAIRQMRHWQVLDDRLQRDESHDPEYCPTCRMEEAG